MSLARLRYLLAHRGRAIAVVLLVVGLAGLGVAGAMAANPPTTEVTDRTNVQTVETTPTVQATVTNGSSVYDRGTVLTDQPVYLLSASPNATLALETALPATGGATHTVTVEYVARHGGEVFWRHSEVLPTRDTTSGDSRVVSSETALDVAAIHDGLQTYRTDFGDAGTVSATLRVDVAYEFGDRAGTLEERYPLSIGPTSYDIETASLSRTHADTHTRAVAVPRPGGVEYRHVGALGALALLAGIGVLIVRHSPLLGRAETAQLAVHHHRFAEWISAGSLPADAGPVVHVDTLADLVDVGIDARRRVIHDADAGAYAVIDDGVTYRFEPDAA